MAAGDIIKIDSTTTTATLASELIEFIRVIRKAIEMAEQVKGTMDHMTAAQIEEMFGLAAGNGATIQTLVTGSRSAVRSASTLEIIDRVRPGINV